jgi:hypothetical protein
MRTDREAFARFSKDPMISLFAVIVAAAACLITFVVVRRVFQDHLRLGPPNLLAALIAGLAFLGLTTGGEGMAAGLLIPYEALAVTLLLLFLLFGISRLVKSRLNHGGIPEAVRERDSKHHGSCSPKSAFSSPPRPHPRQAGATAHHKPEPRASAKDATQWPN